MSDKVASSTYNNLECLFDEKPGTNESPNLKTEIAKVINFQLFCLKNYRLFRFLKFTKTFWIYNRIYNNYLLYISLPTVLYFQLIK